MGTEADAGRAQAPSGEYKRWAVTRTVTLGAAAADVWDVIGGFYTIARWHPSIELCEVPADQTSTRQLRRKLTFPGQAPTTEELVSLDDADFHYRYKWHSGDWGERVRDYHASLRVFAGDLGGTCVVQWASTFSYPTDAISEFYLAGFTALSERFPLTRAT